MEIKEEAARIRPAGPKLAHNRYEREEECTTQFFRKFRTKHANTNINELYTVEDWNDRRSTEETEPTTTDETESLAEASKYYEWPYKPKRTEKEETQTLLKTLSDDPIPKYIAKRTDGEITKEQIKFAIRKLGNNKSPGPDGLPAEFYKIYEDIITAPLKEALDECYKSGGLTGSMKQGDIVLIYKKKDPKEIRNYRPITLLNSDYKILTTILAERLKKVCEAAISGPQKGFVPGRQITDLLHQVYLMQEYVDTYDKEALLALLDMEKAFDRCSWEFLKKAMDKIGLEEEIKRWIGTIYNEKRPPIRQIKMNGRKSQQFKIGSGVAQGCPLSPLLFLFIGEPLTRLVLKERELKGVKIGEHEHKVGQFADDTAAMLEGYEQLEKLFEIINKWEKATGMACNKAKTAIIPMGATRRKEVPETLLREL